MAAHHSYKESVKTVWKTTAILAIVTILEVTGAISYPETAPRIYLNIFVILMSILKAFYIVAIFMHLKYEIKNLIVTILFPTTILIWFIIAFLYEGAWYQHARDFGLLDWFGR